MVWLIISRCVVLLASMLADFLYYQQLTFPPFRFLYFNLARSLAVHYGKNDWHYYLTQGYPLLLTTFLPFGLSGILQALFPAEDAPLNTSSTALFIHIRRQLATVSIFVPLVLSLIAHKEVRFVYPLLPALHILAASPFATFFLPVSAPRTSKLRSFLFCLLAIASVGLAFFATTLHQRGPIDVLSYLRDQHTQHYLSQPPTNSLVPTASTMTVAFLMPCHSTPWRSHLVFPSIKAWALTCEPPLHLPPSEHEAYLDEADLFYQNPRKFISLSLGGKPPRTKGEYAARLSAIEAIGNVGWDGKEGRKPWTEYLVFFEQLEPVMKEMLKGSGYRQCWQGWSSFGHDDWRRKGDVVVWCLNGKGRGKRKDGG